MGRKDFLMYNVEICTYVWKYPKSWAFLFFLFFFAWLAGGRQIEIGERIIMGRREG